MTHVSFRILGPLEALVDGRVVDLPSRGERALLGVLLLRTGEVVSIDALIDSVWDERAPVSARHMVHEYVSRLRAALGDATVIATRAPGYLVERESCELDSGRFAELLGSARSAVAAQKLHEALRAYDEALGLWRGDALSDLALEGDARSAATRLDDQRRAARSERVDVALVLGRHHELIPDLERAVAAEPLDEQLRGQLMLALYRDGRQADALERYREGRRRLVEQVGIEPGAELRALEQAILRHDPALAQPSVSEAFAVHDETPAPPPRRRRGPAAAAAGVFIAGLAMIAAVAATRVPSSAAPVRTPAIAVVDAVHPHLLGSVPVTAPPGAIAYGAGSVWVSLPEARSVLRISPESRQVAGSIPLGVAAQSLAVAGPAVWALGSGAKDPYLTLERINPTFGTVSRMPRVPVVVRGDIGSLSARGETLLVAPRTGLLTRIDARSGHTVRRLDPNAAPAASALGFGSSWLAYREADLVVRVDSLGTITQIPVGRGPSAIAVGKRAVWVANALDGTVMRIDPGTGGVIKTIDVGSNPTAIATDRDSVWVASGGEGKLVRIDERSNDLTGTVKTGGSPQSLAIADGKVWASVQTPAPAHPSGGTAVVSVPVYVNTLDPGVAFNVYASPLIRVTCARLLGYPDEPGAGSLRLVPDAARSLPTVSKDGRTYTFTIRPGMRFSPPSNQPVTAQTFKRTIERSVNPRLQGDGQPPGQMFLRDVVGAPGYMHGRTRSIPGVVARGDRLTIHLTQRAPDLPYRLAVPLFCAVPTDTPIRPVFGALPSAGPYYVASATRGRGFVLLRNPNYHGDRLRRLRRIEVIVGAPHPIAQIEASKLDYAVGGVPAGEGARLERLYGPHSAAAGRGRQRFFVSPTLETDYVELNTRRPLFASARMRRAASYAVNRRALAATGGSWSTAAVPEQMHLPPGMPGFRDAHVYPLVPDLARARHLAGSGHHEAELYCILEGGSPQAAQIIKNNLAAIGIDVHVHCMPGDAFFTRMFNPSEPWDMAIDGYGANYPDPTEFINGFALDNNFNFTHYHDPGLSRRIHAASRLSGVRRAEAYSRIDLELTRDAVPVINFANVVGQDFFSARIGCQLFQPIEGVDLGALCIRPRSH